MSSCSATCGIDKQRTRERERVLAAIRSAYPEGAASDAPLGEARTSLREIESLGIALAELLPVRSFVRPALTEADCDWLYLLVGIHERALLEIELGLCESSPTQGMETYVRLGFSSLGPFVTLSESVLTFDPESRVLTEEPRVGVEDRRLQHIVKGLQGALRKRKLLLLDAAFLCAPMDGESATPWTYLFEEAEPGAARFTAW